MDAVLLLLHNSYNENVPKATQVSATKEISDALSSNPCDSLGVLLQICCASVTDTGASIPMELRGVASTQVRNFFAHCSDEDIIDKLQESPNFSAFREVLLKAVLETHDIRIIRSQLTSCVGLLVVDTKWNLYDQVAPLLRSATSPGSTISISQAIVLVELVACVTKNFHLGHIFKSSISIPVAADLITTLPGMLQLHLSTPNPGEVKISVGYQELTHRTLKVFGHCLELVMKQQSNLSSGMIEGLMATVRGWYEFMTTFIRDTLPLFLSQSENNWNTMSNNRAFFYFTKSVKRISMIIFDILTHINSTTNQENINAKKKKSSKIKYSAEAAGKMKSRSPLAHKLYMEEFSAKFYAVTIEWLQFSAGEHRFYIHKDVTDEVQRNVSKSLMSFIRSIKIGALVESLYCNTIKPHFMDLISLLFSTLCYDPSVAAIIECDDDLQEFSMFIGEQTLPQAEMSVQMAATNCICGFTIVSRPFHDATLFYKLMDTLGTSLRGVDEHTGEETSGHPQLIYGYLHLLGQMKKEVKKREEIWTGTQLEDLIMSCVLPRLRSNCFYLRVKAAITLHMYARVHFTSDEKYAVMVSSVAALISDPDARIRLTGIDCVLEFLSITRARPFLGTLLIPLVNECMAMMERVSTPFIPACLNYLAEHYGYELTPVLDKVCQGLCTGLLAQLLDMKHFEESLEANYVELNTKEMDNSEHKVIALISSFKALNELVIACEHNAPLLLKMCPDLIRPLEAVFTTQELFSLVEHVADVLMHILFSAKPLPEPFWGLFPHIHNLIMNHCEGVNSAEELMNCVDNYLSSSCERFFSDERVPAMTLEMSHKILQLGSIYEVSVRKSAPFVISAMFHNAKSVCDAQLTALVPQVVSLASEALRDPDTANSSPLSIIVVAMVMDSLYFNQEATVSALIAQGGLYSFFSSAAKCYLLIDEMSVHRKKQYIFGLSAFLQYFITKPSFFEGNADVVRVALQTIIDFLVKALASNMNIYIKRSERLRESMANGYAEEDIMECDEGDLDLEGDDELDIGSDDSDFCEEDEIADEDMDYFSPMDKVCEVKLFINLFIETAQAAGRGELIDMVTAAGATMEHFNEAARVSEEYMRLSSEREMFDKAIVEKRSNELVR